LSQLVIEAVTQSRLNLKTKRITRGDYLTHIIYLFLFYFTIFGLNNKKETKFD